MSLQEGLRSLAAHEHAPAPWNFEAFEQRRARACTRRRVALWSSALSVAMLGMVGILALVTQPQMMREPPLAATALPFDSEPETVVEQPALVDMNQFDVTSELEDRIALLDAELSAARVQRAPMDQLRRIESTREQMNQSLQRVSYAHALLNL
ncbi:MAG TPA: hypothetical protein VN645_01225 [Steroidobacteraceae bacterium]|nr:hypothetical protein [Steroidobacteraceae bacterium]